MAARCWRCSARASTSRLFIRDVVDIPQKARPCDLRRSIAGAIQAYRDARFIDFHSLTNAIERPSGRSSACSIRPSDRDVLKQMMTEVTSDQVEVRSKFMQIDGRQMLVGVGYLDKLGWYNVAVMDVDTIIDRSLFLPIGLLLAATMLIVALVIAFIFRFGVVDRLRKVREGRRRGEGRYQARAGDAPTPAMTRLAGCRARSPRWRRPSRTTCRRLSIWSTSAPPSCSRWPIATSSPASPIGAALRMASMASRRQPSRMRGWRCC